MRNNLSLAIRIAGIVPALAFGVAEAILAIVLTWSYPRFIILTLLFWIAVGVSALIAFGAKWMFIRFGRGLRTSPQDPENDDLPDLLSFSLLFVVFVHEALALFRVIPGPATDRSRLLALAVLGILSFIFYRTLRTRWRRAAPRRVIYGEFAFLVAAAAGLRVVLFRLISPEFPFDRWRANLLVQAAFLIGLFVLFLVPFGRDRRRRVMTITVAGLVAFGAIAGFLPLKNALEIGASERRSTGSGGGAAGPNIVLLMLDTARAADMSLYGFDKPTTPRLVELAKDSVLFRSALSVTNWTVPAHASLFTGLVPSVHGSNYLQGDEEVVYPLETRFPTLAGLLRDRGYATAAVVANSYYVSPLFGLTRGFSYVWAGDVRDNFFALPILIERLAGQESRTDLFKKLGVRAVNTADVINDRTSRWLDRRRSSPVFLFANYMEPHGVESLPRSWELSFAARPAAACPRRRQDSGTIAMSEETRTAVRGWYDEEMAYLDHKIGSLVDDLKRRGLYEGSMIMITSDHGELLGEHQEIGHGTWLYEELLRVPLLVKYPGGRFRGEVRDAPVQTVDLFAEILARAGLESPEGIQGQAFDRMTHPIVAESKRVPYLAAQWPGRYGADALCLYSRKAPGFKLIVYADGRTELYDLRADPGETRPVVDPAVLATVEEEVREYKEAIGPLKNLRPESADAERLKKMRSLGYIR